MNNNMKNHSKSGKFQEDENLILSAPFFYFKITYALIVFASTEYHM